MDSSNAIDLFDLAARNSDPHTSQESASVVVGRIAGLRLQFVETLRRLGASTANEVAAAATSDPHLAESIRKRAGECVRLGAVAVAGCRRCKETGSNAQIYQVV